MKIHSLLNYIGHKSKISDQIFEHLPLSVDGTFYDFFSGSCVIGLNAPYSKIACVEYNPFLSNLYSDLSDDNFRNVLTGLINKYCLTNSSLVPRSEYLKDPNIGTVQWMGETISNLHLDQLNKQGYNQIIEDFNDKKFSGIEISAAFMIATIYGRNSGVSTNIQTKKLSGGVGPLDFSIRCSKKLDEHVEILKQNRHTFVNDTYESIKPTKDDYCYFDPPYLVSGYRYSGWSDSDEVKLLKYIDSLPCNWAISNSLQSGKKINTILSDWSKDKIVINIDKNYRKWAGKGETNKKDSKINKEVLILSKDFFQ